MPFQCRFKCFSRWGCWRRALFSVSLLIGLASYNPPSAKRCLLFYVPSSGNPVNTFPYTVAQQVEVKQVLFADNGFPNTIGAVDCTHVAIEAPSLNEFNYVNRKAFHSVKVQIICNTHKMLLNVVERWPGGTNDSFILQNSNVGLRLQDGDIQDGRLIAKYCVSWLYFPLMYYSIYLYDSVFVGDRGYPLKQWLMTPLTNPVTAQESL
ncbi:hypothetical protein UPYG_G00005530 [Umbra pygmaea]|uniref:DDE Tnp4 domain-containing protein n=1 Tax=Umbra pygmaea TaxID=75934 RepID=A0ABD0XHB6_UMBPY